MTIVIFNPLFRTVPQKLFMSSISIRFSYKSIIFELTFPEYLLCYNCGMKSLSTS